MVVTLRGTNRLVISDLKLERLFALDHRKSETLGHAWVSMALKELTSGAAC
jgi:hypothetical protein